MIGTIILIILLVIGVGTLGILFLRKLPKMRMVDPSTAKDSKSKALKYEIMRQRVERSTGRQMQRVQSKFISPIGKGLQNAVRGVAGKLTAVERNYQEKRRETGASKMDQQQLQSLLAEARAHMDQEQWDEAEKIFIEVISHDAKNVQAYEYLGRLYQYKKDYKLAKQTFTFLNKLSKDDASVLASLGEIENKLGNPTKALSYFKKAVKISPKNPRYLDFLVTTAIEEKDIVTVREGVDALKEANPENNKIREFEASLKELQKTLAGK